MKKQEMIKKHSEFSDIIKNSRYIKNNDFIIYYRDNNYNQKRFGIAISKKIGKAVTRNKLKRQTREIIDKLKTLFKNNKDYIIMIRKGCLETSFNDRLKNLEQILKENHK